MQLFVQMRCYVGAVDPFARPASRPPLWREGRIGLEAAALLRDPVFRGEQVADGRGQPVLLIPGFLAGDDSLALMTRWLRRTGHHTSKAGMRANVGCSGRVIAQLEERLERLVRRQGQRATVIGQSRGGSFAKVLAQRRPELVAGIITLGTPQLQPLAIHPLVKLQVVAVGALGTLGAPGLFGHKCLSGDCCAEFWEQCTAPLPSGVRSVSIYSRSDGIVDWRACLYPEAEHVEVESSHIGMAVNAQVYRAIATTLAEMRRREARRRAVTAVPPLRKAA
jgi:pimeloyl-ACP methyl ester carboxylesterase